jgi:hypothetical protein
MVKWRDGDHERTEEKRGYFMQTTPLIAYQMISKTYAMLLGIC